jgi:hypothetical protein
MALDLRDVESQVYRSTSVTYYWTAPVFHPTKPSVLAPVEWLGWVRERSIPCKKS